MSVPAQVWQFLCWPGIRHGGSLPSCQTATSSSWGTLQAAAQWPHTVPYTLVSHCALQCAVFNVQCSVCSVQCAVFSVQCLVCCWLLAVSRALCSVELRQLGWAADTAVGGRPDCGPPVRSGWLGETHLRAREQHVCHEHRHPAPGGRVPGKKRER